MATVRILLGFVCFAFVGRQHLRERNLLSKTALHYAVGEIGVREIGANNAGPRVSAYLAATGIHHPAAWCAAFVSWCFKQAGSAAPRTAWSPALFPASRISRSPEPGDVFGIYFPALKRIGHCGFVERLSGDWVVTVEGNTNVAGSREGDGVYRKWRPRYAIYRYVRW